MEPDKNCFDCHGTGEILLLNRSVPCFCLDRKIEIVDEDNDPLELKKLFDEQVKKYSANDFGWPII